MEPPSWLTSALVQDILSSVKKDDIVKCFHIESATKPGDNFLSSIYRLKIESKAKSKVTVIIKTASGPAEANSFISIVNGFSKEVLVYTELLPHFERLWFDHTGEVISFGPKCHFATTEPVPIIAMDDLRMSGYLIRDRKIGLNIRETKMVLEKIAKFHACSVKRYEEFGPYDNELFVSGWDKDELREFFNNYYDTTFDQFLWTVENNVKDGSNYLPKLRNYAGQQFKVLKQHMAFEPEKFNVIGHSDLWMTNFLFDGPEESSTNVLLIDFQICQWTSPATDLLTLLFTSCGAELIIAELNNLIEFYHKQLVDALGILKCNTESPSLDEFSEQIKIRGPTAVLFISDVLSRTVPGPDVDLSLWSEKSPEADQLRMHVYSTSKYVETLGKLLPFLDLIGYLDI